MQRGHVTPAGQPIVAVTNGGLCIPAQAVQPKNKKR